MESISFQCGNVKTKFLVLLTPLVMKNNTRRFKKDDTMTQNEKDLMSMWDQNKIWLLFYALNNDLILS